MGSPRYPSSTLQAIGSTVCYLPKFDDKILLLKTPLLELQNMEKYSCKEKYSSVLSAMNLQAIIITSLARYVYWCKIGSNVMGVTSCLLIAFKACSMRKNPQLTQNLWSVIP